jgi:hypothetical protein
MEHFLTKIINANGDDLSADKSVHGKFVRFSKGQFEGAALKAIRRGKVLTIKATVDYEYILGYLALETIPGSQVALDGNITVFDDPAEAIATAIPADKKDSITVDKKKTNWIVSIEGTWGKDEAKALFETFAQLRGYILLCVSVEGDKTVAFTVKSKPPQNKGEFDFDKAIAFSTLKLPNTAGNVDRITSALFPDFKEKTEDFKEITLENTYDIADITIPGEPSENKRIAAVRKGKLTRTLTIDENQTKKEFDFSA